MIGQTLAVAGLVVFWYMTGLFLVALARRDNSLADVAWGPGIFLASLATLWWHDPWGLLPVLVIALVGVWAGRLGIHIHLRNKGRGEDWRYAAWRAAWGRYWPLRSYLGVFMVQGVLLVVVALPALYSLTYGGPVKWLSFVGALVWLYGFLWESIADHQLVRFMKNPANKGRVLQTGLWRFSRHPNYFGEIMLWWGLWLIALSSLPGGWWTVAGPLVISYLIVKVSGVPLLERKMLQNPAYREYVHRTPALVPWKMWK